MRGGWGAVVLTLSCAHGVTAPGASPAPASPSLLASLRNLRKPLLDDEPVELALGQRSCARTRSRAVRCWGERNDDPRGAHAGVPRAPKHVPGAEGAAQLAVGPYHACARTSAGTVRCWGSNGLGQLGDGTTASGELPRTVPGLTGVAQVSLGESHSCARRFDGSVWCWGFNGSGQLGDGTWTDHRTPRAVMRLGETLRATQLAAGHFHTCARTEDGAVWCWGFNGAGQLGDGTLADRLAPVRVRGLPAGVRVERVAAGRHHTCALLEDGAAWCWGENASGQLGDGGTRDRASPAPVMGVRDLTELSLGDRHTCARRVEGSVFCWGANRDGQLGDGTNLDRPRPNRVPALTDVAQIALGERHSCARLGDGTVRCWGDNDRGAVGDGGTVDRWTPTPVAW